MIREIRVGITVKPEEEIKREIKRVYIIPRISTSARAGDLELSSRILRITRANKRNALSRYKPIISKAELSCGDCLNMNNRQHTLVLSGVTKRFDEFTAVSDLSLAVSPGRIYGLIGPNGAGKTTTIRMIVNITAPDIWNDRAFRATHGTRTAGSHRLSAGSARPLQKMRVDEQLRFSVN